MLHYICIQTGFYAFQGFAVLLRASDTFGHWKFNLVSIARMWRGGCIIRSIFLNDIAAAFEAKDKTPKPSCYLISDEIADCYPDGKRWWCRLCVKNFLFPLFFGKNYFYHWYPPQFAS